MQRVIIIVISVNEDYTPVSTIVEFQPGETQQQISVRINNDKQIERNETFQIYLIAGAGVNLSPFPRTDITIENDDGKYSSFQFFTPPCIAGIYSAYGIYNLFTWW